jgi:hypothetical protein
MTGCAGGGYCCRDVHVPLTAFDVLRLACFLGVSTADIMENMATITPEGAVEIDGAPECPLLNCNLCSVYSGRPDSCRRYPFWSIPHDDGEWLVERHTCQGCWDECRSQRKSVGEVVAEAGMDVGRNAEKLYLSALDDLDQAGADEDLVAEFMTRIYDSDSEGVPEGAADRQTVSDTTTDAELEQELGAHFHRVVACLRTEFLGRLG